MRRFETAITAAATLGLAAFVYAQSSPAPGQPDYSNTQPRASSEQSMPPGGSSPPPAGRDVPPGQPAPDSESAAAESPSPAQGPTQSSRLAELVPSDMSATEACDGFTSMTECAAALHAAKNTGIPFKDLKTKMTGGEKLGAAIHDLKPGADVRAEVSRAEEQAKADVRSPQG
jgi:hypothetical protein